MRSPETAATNPRATTSRLLCIVLALGLAASSVFGQGAIHEQIKKVSAEIKADPEKSHLWLKRGRLYMEDKNWAKAAEDMKQALKIEPEGFSSHFFLAQIDLESGRPQQALKRTEAFLGALDPSKKGARFRGEMLKGDVLTALGRHEDAATVYGQALLLNRRPQPVHFLAHANALVAAERTSDAITALDAGLARIGSIPSLEIRAIEILTENGGFQDALERLEALAKSSANATRWRVEQGDLYQRIDDPKGAARAYAQALAAHAALPAGRRGVPAMKALQERAQAGLNAVQVPVSH